MVVGGAPDRCAAPLAAQRVALFALDAGALQIQPCLSYLIRALTRLQSK